ncbi:hypothetical protein GCM10010401_18880 [Rarobacter faecitabidus]|uniref:ATP-binding cassette subfamily C protein CydD n=1 Tax=Rarobacter faecitabidus TaxID=13243 RepID=A0A542ZUR2_RARFA|nr:thiol reductant ABC exporter subunit CydD [Rarobacter faecitabidus]TQL64098.1 ATP-binding cassette subfamily C protein CydD [Rarobacter faecitabidus]
MKPLDPRLLKVARPARSYVALTAALGAVTAALVVAQCLLIAHILAPVVGRTANLSDQLGLIGWLAAALAARVVVAYLSERYGQHAGPAVVADLRSQVVARAASLGPRWSGQGNNSEIVTLATRGLDDLQPYLTRYLPQLFLAATVTPAALLVVLDLDWVAAAIILGTLPLVPLFMWLVGVLTQTATTRRQEAMARLGAQVLDLIAGIPTLRALHREQGPAKRVRQLSDSYRRTTMGTLRIAFLSGFVLELLTTLSVALVAVAVGLRLVHGGLDLTTGLAVIMLAPEVYLPVRQIGTHFHASADGIAAVEKVFALLDTPAPDAAAQARITAEAGQEASSSPAPQAEPTGARQTSTNDQSITIALESLSVQVPGSLDFAPADLSCELRPGTITALAGANGSGKSTAVLALLGMISPTRGTIRVNGIDLADLDLDRWHERVTWLPQRAWLWPGTIADNVAAGTAASAADLDRAARLTGLDDVLRQRGGYGTLVGAGGVGLSVGQRQRVGLARALQTAAPVVVMDEPTAHLDDDLSQAIASTLQQLRDDGRTILIVTHRADLLAAADHVIEVRRG